MYKGIVDHNGNPIRLDGYVNPLTGYGTVDDNIENTSFLPSKLLTQGELEALYESNWIIGRGVELPVNDRFSKGISFLTNDDDSDGRKAEIENLESMMKQAKMWSHLITANYWDRLFAGAVIYFDFGDDMPFGTGTQQSGFRQTAAIKTSLDRTINFELKDSQKGLPNKIWVVDRFFAFPQSYYTPQVHGFDHPKLGEPEIYSLTLHTTGYSRLVYAHESRCIIFGGLPVSTRQRAVQQMWGNSLVQRNNDICKYLGIGLKAMADTLEDFNYKSLEVENLADLIEKGSWDIIGEATALAAKNTHNQSVGVHGKETKLVKQSTPVNGLVDMVQFFSNIVSGSFGIPDSRFFSAKGGALGGSSAESDERNYYSALSHQQEHKDRPNIERFFSLLGFDPLNFPFVFAPLSETTEIEELTAKNIQADIDVKYIQVQVVAPEEVAISRFSGEETNKNQMIIDFDSRKEMTNDEEDVEEDSEDDKGEKTEPDENKEEKEDSAEEVNTASVEPIFKLYVRKEVSNV